MLTHRRCYTPDWCSLVTRHVTNVRTRISQAIKADIMQHTYTLLQPSSNATYWSGDTPHWRRNTTSGNSLQKHEWMTPGWCDGACLGPGRLGLRFRQLALLRLQNNVRGEGHSTKTRSQACEHHLQQACRCRQWEFPLRVCPCQGSQSRSQFHDLSNQT